MDEHTVLSLTLIETAQLNRIFKYMYASAITSMEKSVFQEGTPDEQRKKSPTFDHRVLNGIDNNPDDRVLNNDRTVNTENDIRQQKTSSLKRGKRETVVLRPLSLTRKSN